MIMKHSLSIRKMPSHGKAPPDACVHKRERDGTFGARAVR
jgi:hypothetical protein